MNKAAVLVASSLNDNRFKTLVLGGKAYTFKPLTIRQISLVMEDLAKVEFTQNANTALFEVSEQSDLLISGIAKALSYDWEPIHEQLKECTGDEVKKAIDVVIEMIGADSFFQCAHSVARVALMIATPK